MKTFHVTALNFDRTLTKQAESHNNDWGRTVLGRINKVFDLHAANKPLFRIATKKFYLVKPLRRKDEKENSL